MPLVNLKGASTHVHTLWPKLEDHSSQPFFAASTEPCYTFLRYGLGVLLACSSAFIDQSSQAIVHQHEGRFFANGHLNFEEIPALEDFSLLPVLFRLESI